MSYSPISFGPNSLGSSRSLQTSYQNGTGLTLSKGTPASVNTSGNIVMVNVTSDISVASIVGLAVNDIPPSATGLVMDSGRLENVTTSFAVGDPLYINTDGTLINIRPAIGVGAFVAGDKVVFVGVVVKNEFNPSNKDFKLYLTIIGQL